MSKRILFLIPALLALGFFLFRSQEKEKPLKKESFEKLMGSDLSFVQTREDKENFAFFKRLYEKNFEKLSETSDALRIPKTIHVIWLGPKEFPQSSISNLRSWIEKHPEWTVKFWTDIDREAPHPKMQKVLVLDSDLPHFYTQYYQSDNFGERSALLRYEILLREGGVYVDHDLFCTQKLDRFNRSLDFYCPLAELGSSIFSTSVFSSNHLLASKPNHPILECAIEWVIKRWDPIEQAYPGKDPTSTLCRVKHRTFSVLNEAILQRGDRGHQDLMFPPSFFSLKKASSFSFATHEQAGSWIKPESDMEKKLILEVEAIQHKISQIELFLFALAALSLCLGVFFFIYKRPKAVHAP
jgi:mannosyltransferase OCH1-like enzyme